jgi:hypothetical protein
MERNSKRENALRKNRPKKGERKKIPKTQIDWKKETVPPRRTAFIYIYTHIHIHIYEEKYTVSLNRCPSIYILEKTYSTALI